MALAARYVPAGADMAVGGDWYDVVELPSGHIGLAIGDVAGHGRERPRPWDSYGWPCAPTRWRNRHRPRS
jgi:hypothetical protein